MIFSGYSWQAVYNDANLGINLVKQWLDSNLLSLNINKSCLVPFSLTCSGQLPLTIHNKLSILIHNCSSADIYDSK